MSLIAKLTFKMSLYELREIAKRQQEYIGTQQKLILSIEAKLKHLKETSVSSKINDQQMKVNKLRDTVNIQETRLRQLKALRGQVKQINNNNHGTRNFFVQNFDSCLLIFSYFFFNKISLFLQLLS